MNDKGLKKTSDFLIAGGFICQFGFLLAAFLDESRSLIMYCPLMSAVLAICLLVWGYYLNLKSKGYISFRSGWFYWQIIITLLLPVFGSIVAIEQLSLIPQHGEKMDRRKKFNIVLTFAVFVLIVTILFLIAWPSIAPRFRFW